MVLINTSPAKVPEVAAVVRAAIDAESSGGDSGLAVKPLTGEYPITCGKCGYDVRELPSRICPECGSDLLSVGTVERDGSVWPWQAWAAGLAAAALCIGLPLLLHMTVVQWLMPMEQRAVAIGRLLPVGSGDTVIYVEYSASGSETFFPELSNAYQQGQPADRVTVEVKHGSYSANGMSVSNVESDGKLVVGIDCNGAALQGKPIDKAALGSMVHELFERQPGGDAIADKQRNALVDFLWEIRTDGVPYQTVTQFPPPAGWTNEHARIICGFGRGADTNKFLINVAIVFICVVGVTLLLRWLPVAAARRVAKRVGHGSD